MSADPATQPIRVLVADDAEDIRALLGEILAVEPGLELVGSASDAEEAIALATALQPDVALLDVQMPHGGGPRAAREIRAASPGTRLLALSGSHEREAVFAMLRAGASGYVVKGAPLGEMLEAIRTAARGGTILSERIAGGVVDELVAELDRRSDEDEQRERWTKRIEAAIDGEQPGMTMVFQPVVDLDTGEIVGAEALARFPATPRTRPDTWFKRAAELGMRQQLELAAVRAALANQDELPNGAWLSVNVSPQTAMAPELLDVLSDHDGARLVLEMTEHDPIDDYDALAAALDELRALGCRIAVDDAGSGAAGLRHILMIGAEFIKLDTALSHGIAGHEARGAVGRALIAFATEIGASVIAEGIETELQLGALQGLGVHLGQGYFLARPAALPLEGE